VNLAADPRAYDTNFLWALGAFLSNSNKLQVTAFGQAYRNLSDLLHMCVPVQNAKGSKMYLRKIDGPRSVTLPDGTVMTRADLPPADTRRWVASRKAAVIKAVGAGLVTRAEALEMYSLSDDELSEWETAVTEHGEAALKATSLQRYRQP
jgi:hypothetical protein